MWNVWMPGLLSLLACRGDGDLPPPPEVSLLPEPVLVDPFDAVFVVDGDTVIATGPGAEAVGDFLAAELGLERIEADGSEDAIVLTLDADVPPEGYTLDIDESVVAITASDTDGLFWGTRTLLQLITTSSARSTPWHCTS
jgi:hexosaminidase